MWAKAKKVVNLLGFFIIIRSEVEALCPENAKKDSKQAWNIGLHMMVARVFKSEYRQVQYFSL